MNSIIYIPARSGSKRIINKNIKKFLSKPLIYWTIDFALRFKNTKIIISTNNQKWCRLIKDEYKNRLENLIILKRPNYLSRDKSNIINSITNDLRRLNENNKFIKILLLQPTSPYRNYKKILKIFNENVNKKSISISSFELMKDDKSIFIPRHNQLQRSNIYLKANGNFYICSIDILKKYNSFINKETIPYISKNNYENIDIDQHEDWKKAENLLKNKKLPVHLYNRFT